MEIRINEYSLRTFAENILHKAGLARQDAFTVADSLVFSNLRGIDSHGVMRLPFYVLRLEVGGTNPNPDIRIVQDRSASALIDGDNGMGPVVSVHAAELAVQKARHTGAAFIGVKGSSHSGAISYYALRISDANMVGISISNTTPVMAAWGGSGSAIGNNPISIAAPYQDGKPLVLDIAMSHVAGGKVRLAARNGKKIPRGWIIDSRGRDSEDPNDLPNGGALLPFGAHKGFALAIMIEVLGGVLTGSGMLGQIPFWVQDTRTPLNIGHSFIAIDIGGFMSIEEYHERVEWMVHTLKSSPPAEGSPGIFMPGELEWQTEQERRRNGIPVSPEVYEDLKKLGSRYNEPLPVSENREKSSILHTL